MKLSWLHRLTKLTTLSIAVLWLRGRLVAGCGGFYTSESGTISSLEPYGRGQTCYYKITLPFFRTWVRLEFTKFRIDGEMPGCSKDRLEVWIGCSSNARKLATFCSNNMLSIPHAIYSKERCVQLVLHASTLGTSKDDTGFSLDYYSDDGNAGISYSCKNYQKRYSESGVIASPQWPQPFSRDDFQSRYLDCNWDIIAEQGNLIQVNFMDIDFSKKMNSNYGCSSYASNYLKVKGDKSVLKATKETYRYCSTPPSLTYNSKYYEVEVKLNGYYKPSSSERGFVLGYVIYRDADAANTINWAIIVGITIVVLFIFLGGYCFVKSVRTRRANRAYVSETRNVVNYSADTGGATITTPVAAVHNDQSDQPLITGKAGYPHAAQNYPVNQPYGAPPVYTDAPPPYPGPPVSGNVVCPPTTVQPYPPILSNNTPLPPYPPPPSETYSPPASQLA